MVLWIHLLALRRRLCLPFQLSLCIRALSLLASVSQFEGVVNVDYIRLVDRGLGLSRGSL